MLSSSLLINLLIWRPKETQSLSEIFRNTNLQPTVRLRLCTGRTHIFCYPWEVLQVWLSIWSKAFMYSKAIIYWASRATNAPVHGSWQLVYFPPKAGQPGRASWSYIALVYSPNVLLQYYWVFDASINVQPTLRTLWTLCLCIHKIPVLLFLPG